MTGKRTVKGGEGDNKQRNFRAARKNGWLKQDPDPSQAYQMLEYIAFHKQGDKEEEKIHERETQIKQQIRNRFNTGPRSRWHDEKTITRLENRRVTRPAMYKAKEEATRKEEEENRRRKEAYKSKTA